MEKPLDLIVFYTHNLRGDLDLLPRLYTLIHKLKSAPYEGRKLLVDLGDSCSPDVWHCDATGGRSTLIVMDAMGYDAANASGFLTAEGRAKLEGNVSVGMVAGEHSFERDRIVFTCQPQTDSELFQISLAAAEENRVEGSVLFLGGIRPETVGMAWVKFGEDGKPHLFSQDKAGFGLYPAILPDPTIAATVEFVVSEARRYERKKG